MCDDGLLWMRTKSWARPAALTGSKIKFIDNNMIDVELKTHLAWDSMIVTMPRKLANKEHELSHDLSSLHPLLLPE